MKTFKKLNTVFLFLIVTLSCFGQGPQKNEEDRAAMKEKMNTLKIAYITEKLDLTEDEAEKFWPIYNQTIKEKDALKSSFSNKGVKLEDLSDKEIEERLKQKFIQEQKLLDLDIALSEKLKSVIGVKKVAQLYKAEHNFKKEMFNKLKKGDNNRSKNGSPRN